MNETELSKHVWNLWEQLKRAFLVSKFVIFFRFLLYDSWEAKLGTNTFHMLFNGNVARMILIIANLISNRILGIIFIIYTYAVLKPKFHTIPTKIFLKIFEAFFSTFINSPILT